MKQIPYYLFLLFILVNISLCAQEYGYKHYTTQDGLAQSQAGTLFQDSRGYLWVGTKGGVSRFDGITFLNFTLKEGLLNNQIHLITEDKQGNIWFLTHDGLACYNGIKITSYPTEVFRNNRGLLTFYESKPGHLIVVTVNEKNQIIFTQFSQGKYAFLSTLFQATNHQYPQIPGFDCVYDSSQKVLWLASNPYGLFKITGETKEKIPIAIHELRALKTGADGKLYLFANDSVFRINSDTAVYLYEDKGNFMLPNTKSCCIDKDGKVFYEDGQGVLQIYDKRKIISEKFNFNEISVLFTDNENNLWIGTESGLYRQLSRAFVNFVPDKSGIGNLIWSISEDKYGRIWFASYIEGLQYYEHGKLWRETKDKKYRKSYQDRYYMGSIIDHNKNILFPMTTHGALKYDGQTFTKLFPDSLELVTFYFFEDQDNFDLYAGTGIGVYRISKGNDFKNLGIEPGNGKSRITVSIIKDKLNRFWFGGFNGITLLQGEKKIHLPTQEIPFSKGAIAMLQDKQEQIWIGNAEGLFTYDYKDFKQIEHHALSSMVTSLALVGDSALLIGSVSGLAMLDLKAFYQNDTVKIIAMDYNNGFMGLEVGQNAIFRDSQGLYWIATSDRVVQFDPALYKSNAVPPDTYISGINVLNDEMEWEKINISSGEKREFRFSNKMNNLRFDFIGISTTSPEGVRFSHFLEGYDKGWSEITNERYAVYTNLSPGKYRLLLKSCNADGIWSPMPASVAFELVPAIYQRTWFNVLMALLVAALLVFVSIVFSNRRKLRQQKKLETENRLAQLKLLSLKNQLDPHFTYNAINSIASAVLKENKELAYTYFVKLSRLMRAIVGSSENLVCSLKEEVEFVKDYLEINKFRFQEKFDYKISIGPEVDMNIPIPKMVIQSFAENALKHGLYHLKIPGNLLISIFNDNEDLKIIIEDNGIGREAARKFPQSSTGKGLMIIKGYCDYFNKFNQRKIDWSIIDLHNEKGIACGTRVVVNIPKGYVYEGQNSKPVS